MKPYQVKVNVLAGSEYREVIKQARFIYHQIEKKTKRKPYVRSAYFGGQKIFFDSFWQHLSEKAFRVRIKRLKYFPCGIELIQNSHLMPTSKINVDRKREILHRFYGQTRGGDAFFVQIKEDIKTNRKYLMSIFPKE